MNVFVSILQVLLAAHTAIGAAWKSSNSERTVPSLGAIPHGVWQALVVPELLCAIGLIVPLFSPRAAALAPVAAAGVVVEMLYFSAVHLTSGAGGIGPVIYWLVVAAVGAFIVYGRLVLVPGRSGSRVVERARP